MEGFGNALKAFLQAADLQVVLAVLVATRLVELTVLAPRGWKAYSLWFPVLFACLFTPAFSTAPETSWGGQFFWRSVVLNGMVSAFVYYQILPRARAQYEKWFGKIPSNGANGDAHPQ
jgi:hypothetical protein